MDTIYSKTVLLRVDYNVPIENGTIVDPTRIHASFPTITSLISRNNKLVILSHLGRPKSGIYDEKLSLRLIAEYLDSLLGGVGFCGDLLETDVHSLFNKHHIVVAENVRFWEGETSCDDDLCKKLASIGDYFVMDAFGTCHRAHATTSGLANHLPSCFGLLMNREVLALQKVMEDPARPLVAIVGGSKVSSKLTILKNLIDKVDHLIVGGGIANTFLVAQGINAGKSLVEMDLVDEAKAILCSGKVVVPIDAVIADKFSSDAQKVIVNVENISDTESGMILDYGPKSAEHVDKIIQSAGTILWNGPVGVFEFNNFSDGTRALAESVAKSDSYSVAGGGDTIAAVNKFGVKDDVSYISTGGGAFLEFIEGKSLPGIQAILNSRLNVPM